MENCEELVNVKECDAKNFKAIKTKVAFYLKNAVVIQLTTLTQMTISLTQLWLDSIPDFVGRLDSDSTSLCQNRIKLDSQLMSRTLPCFLYLYSECFWKYLPIELSNGVWFLKSTQHLQKPWRPKQLSSRGTA